VKKDDDWHWTAVARVLAFTLHSLVAKQPGQSWFDAAKELNVWETERYNPLKDIPDSSPEDRIDRNDLTAADYKQGQSKGGIKSQVKTRAQCKRDADQMGEEDEDDESPSTPRDRRERGAAQNRVKRRRGGAESGAKSDTKSDTKSGEKSNTKSDTKSGEKSGEKTISRQLCTQQCLRGLLTRGALDNNCPNVEQHCGKFRDRNKHAISSSKFLSLMRRQLACDRDGSCEPLRIQGSRGALFKLTLHSYGYTVAAKGTISEFVPYLKHEATIYKRLLPIQGAYIPVCLGAINLVLPFHFFGENIYMLCLSWSGTSIYGLIDRYNKDDVLDLATSSLQAIHQLGVLHEDAMPQNMLWHAKSKKVMIVDFERARVVETKAVETKKDRKEDKQYAKEVKDMRIALSQCVQD